MIVPPVPLKLFPKPSTYTPVPVVAVIVPVFFPELVPAPATYIPRLFPTVIIFLFSTEAVSDAASALATIPAEDVPVDPIKLIVPLFIPLPFPVYTPMLSVPVIIIFPFEVSVELPPTYEAILLFNPVDVIFLVFTRFIPSAAYIPILLFPASSISDPFVTVPEAVPLL